MMEGGRLDVMVGSMMMSPFIQKETWQLSLKSFHTFLFRGGNKQTAKLLSRFLVGDGVIFFLSLWSHLKAKDVVM